MGRLQGKYFHIKCVLCLVFMQKLSMNLKCVAEGATCICIEILKTRLNLGAETEHKFK